MFADNDFTLMNKDRKVLHFHMENKYGGIELYETEREADAVLPVNYTELEPWLSQRQAPKHRAHIEKLLRQCGCYNLDGFVRLTHALSLNDTFWVKSRQSDLNWNDVSLYRNEFDETIARLAFEGGLYGDYFSTTSPEFGTSGSFAKCWVREQDGIYLMKCGSEGFANAGLEPYSEMYASEIASAICHKSVPYTTQMYRGKLVSSCPLFTDEENGFVAMIHFRKTTQPGELLRFMEKYEAEDDFRRMLVLDALILNVDRHPGNYGMIFDTDTMEIKGMAPVFDHNMSLLPYAMQEDFDNLDEYLSSRPARIGIDFNEVANSMLTPDIRADLRNLYGFRFSRNYAYALPEDRLRILESVVNSQINRILKRIPLYIPPADDTGIFKIDR